MRAVIVLPASHGHLRFLRRTESEKLRSGIVMTELPPSMSVELQEQSDPMTTIALQICNGSDNQFEIKRHLYIYLYILLQRRGWETP